MKGDVAAIRSPAADAEVLRPSEILAELAELDGDLHEVAYYSERALFYNPGRTAPIGAIFAAIKDHDGPNDARSGLSRPGVFRFAFQLPRAAYVDRFGAVPPRPSKGQTVQVDCDVSSLNELTPHPVYAWMRWVQILCPTRAAFDSLQPVLEDSLEWVKRRWATKSRTR